jgi:hypothetical protein
MAGQYDFLLGAAFGAQTTRGTADATIAALAGALTEADGLILGDPDSGVGETGISFGLTRAFRDKAVVTGSFSRSFSDFISRQVDSFELAFPLKGAGTTTPTLDADYQLAAGLDELLAACGLPGAAWAGGTGWAHQPASNSLVTAKLWFGDQGTNSIAIVVKDVESSQLALEFTPGSVGIATASLTGVFESVAIETTPTFDYGLQNTVSAPTIRSVGHNWGLTAALRGFSEMTITIDNESETVPDSNSAAGTVERQTGRTIGIEATIFAEDNADLDFELDQLAETNIASAQQLDFQVGTSGEANAYQIVVPSPELQSWTPNKLGASQAYDLVWVARSATANAEFDFILR